MRGMKKTELRRANLNARIKELGGQAAFIEKTGMNQGQVSALQNGTGNRSFGEKLARKIELLAGWPHECLDSVAELDPMSQIEAALTSAEWLRPQDRANLLGLINGMRARANDRSE